jgi:hypothetical protein
VKHEVEIYFGGFFHYDDVKDNHASGSYGFITGEVRVDVVEGEWSCPLFWRMVCNK